MMIFIHFLRYLVLFNPVEQERLCVVTVLVNSAKVRVLTEDGQTLPVQLSAQWVSAVEMSGEVYQVRFCQTTFFKYGTYFVNRIKRNTGVMRRESQIM